MNWSNHRALTGVAVYTITNDMMCGVIAGMASVIPDAIEGSWQGENYQAWQKRHRKESHWVIPYLAAFSLCLLVGIVLPLPKGLEEVIAMLAADSFLLYMAVFIKIISLILLGAIFHIIEDSICGKVPFIHVEQRIGIKLFYVNTWQEKAFTVLMIGTLLLWHFKENFFS